MTEVCENCRSAPWRVGVSHPNGTLRLCVGCGEVAMENRDSKNPKDKASFDRVAKRCLSK